MRFGRHREAMRRGDEGSVLPMVLVLVVFGALVVLPLLDYTIAVFRSNRVVSDRTAESEAAKGGLRVALDDPKNVFLTCDGGGNLTPSPNPTINGISVQTTCTEIGEVGPAVALGFNVPTGAAAMQLGADVPVALSGGTASSPAVPPYPASPDWWATPAFPDPGDLHQYSPDAEDGKIWMPHLPRIPPTVRPAAPYTMPPAFACEVFFPGRYDQPIDLSGRIYFTSGVYYFEEPITIQADADVVVGYGLEDFAPASDCADDLQVAANVINGPTSFDINGGGATFVFGGNGRLVVDNSTVGTSARIRFNQRYADEDRGGRVSIMTVNGDDVADADHVVTDVNSIPRSQVLRIDESGSEVLTPINGTPYLPSAETYTDKARLPVQLPVVDATPLQESGAATDRGVVVLRWDEIAGQDAGGALIGEEDGAGGWTASPYQVQYRVQSPIGLWMDGCDPDEMVITPKAVPTDGNDISCAIDDLDIGTQYRFRVRAGNEVGTAQWRDVDATPENTSPLAVPPDAPTDVDAVAGVADDVHQISWDAPANDGGAPITDYQVDAYTVEIVPHANAAPVVTTAFEHLDVEVPVAPDPPNSVTGHIRAYDPNGDDLTLTIDTTGLPAGLTATVDDAADTITFTADSTAPLGLLTYGVPYTVTDPGGESTTGWMGIDTLPVGGVLPHPPEADPVDLLVDLGTPLTVRLPVNDPDGSPFAPTPVTVDTTGLDPMDWTVTVSDIDVAIVSTAPPGGYSFDYTFTDAAGNAVTSTIDMTIPDPDIQPAGSCSVHTDPMYATPTACEITLPDLTPGTSTSGYQGYLYEVSAINAAGPSVVGTNGIAYQFGFDGGGIGLLPPPTRYVVPWVPEPVVDIRAAASAPVEVSIAGYVAVPMGQLAVDNPNGFDIRINGGVMAGTFDINDPRATAAPDSLPIGFKNDIVLQRRVRIVSVAGNVRSTAIVEVNEDGAGYAVNSWVVG